MSDRSDAVRGRRGSHEPPRRRGTTSRSTSRERLPETMTLEFDPQPTTERRYLFVNQGADRRSSSEAVRVHVMRESHRARRQLRGESQQPTVLDRVGFFTPPERTTTPTRPYSESVRGDQTTSIRSYSDSVRGDPTVSTRPYSDSVRGGQTASTRVYSDSVREVQTMPTQPYSDSVRGNQRAERQISLTESTQLRRGEQILAPEPSLLELRSLAIQYAQGSSRLLRRALDLCSNDRAALNAFIALVMLTTSDASTNYPLQRASDEHEASALEALRTRMRSDTAGARLPTNETLVTVALLANLESVRLNRETASFHSTALLRMLEQRGGLASLYDSDSQLTEVLMRLANLDRSLLDE